jgi:hypothetical protein
MRSHSERHAVQARVRAISNGDYGHHMLILDASASHNRHHWSIITATSLISHVAGLLYTETERAMSANLKLTARSSNASVTDRYRLVAYKARRHRTWCCRV